jgi:multicomponent Na+:H+ antiporter subunit B
MIRRGFILLALLAFGVIFAGLVGGYDERQVLTPLAGRYVSEVPVELGAPNVITGILITFRGFDTLGEVAVLFMVAASMGLLLGRSRGTVSTPAGEGPQKPPSELVRNGAEIIMPLIFLFGAYVIMNGHISAGGGFQGGAVVASGVMLLMIAFPRASISHAMLSTIESLDGVFYVCAGMLGLILAGGFLDTRFLPLGQFGAVFSAGAIPLISILLGIKVGAELSVIIDRFRA